MNKDGSRLSNSGQMNSHRKIGEGVSLLLMILFVIAFSVGTLKDLDEGLKAILSGLEYFFIGCFTVEYVVRVWIADNKRAHIFGFHGIVDLAAILPFYVSYLLVPDVLTDAAVLRILGVTRILVALKFFRHCESSIDIFQRAFAKISTDLGVFLRRSSFCYICQRWGYIGWKTLILEYHVPIRRRFAMFLTGCGGRW